MQEYSDHELTELFHKNGGKENAFNLIIEKYKERAYWHVRRMVLSHEDADDILQEVFIIVWKKLEDFRGDSSLYTWIYRIATNECLSFLNKKKVRNLIPSGEKANFIFNSLEADVYFNGDEAQKKLQTAIALLPEKQKLVFNLKYYDDMKYKEISVITGTSIGALKASYHHAVKKIEQFINEG